MLEISLQGKNALITGAAQGIGKNIALKLAKAGLHGMTIVDLKVDGVGQETKKELEAMGTKVLMIAGDVSDTQTVQLAIQSTVDTFGSLDILVNNAGIARIANLFDTQDDAWDVTMAVNLRAPFLFTKYGALVMREQGKGVIINMASIAGITGGNTSPDYGASKAGVIGLTKYSAKTLCKYGIRVNAVAPGTIATEMVEKNYTTLSPEEKQKRLSSIPMGRMGSPEEVANAVLFLASDYSSYVCGDVLTVTGARNA